MTHFRMPEPNVEPVIIMKKHFPAIKGFGRPDMVQRHRSYHRPAGNVSSFHTSRDRGSAANSTKTTRFTRHAREKFELPKKYGFEISQATVEEAVAKPHLAERKDDQVLVLKPLDPE
jgi:hypothetical protein